MRWCIAVFVFFAASLAACAASDPVEVADEPPTSTATAVAVTGAANHTPLDADAVTELLSGNTVVGQWYGTHYQQFFNTDGTTLYAERDARVSSGEWRVNAATGAYESKWSEFGEWESYAIVSVDSALHWQDIDGSLIPFEIAKGRQLPDE